MKISVIVFIALFAIIHADPLTKNESSPQPDDFYKMFENRQNVDEIISFSGQWTAKIQREHIEFLKKQITDPQVNQESKDFAKKILSTEENLVKTALEDFGYTDPFNYDEVIEEMSNIEEKKPTINEKLRSVILTILKPQ